MQNKNIIVGLFSMLVVVIFGIGYSYADDVYNYESVISTSDWSNMNHAERVEKLSIPNEYIQNMTTTELLNSVLAYPYFSDMLFYDNMQEGFYAVKEHFYGGTTHSGIVIGLSGNCIRSKWGRMNLVDHSVTNCPYYYAPVIVSYYN